jgi:hypothetical protein
MRYEFVADLVLCSDGLAMPRIGFLQVIASSGGNIIAVANPALSMSPAIAPAKPNMSDTGSGTDKRSSTPVVLLKQEPVSPAMSPSPTTGLGKSE